MSKRLDGSSLFSGINAGLNNSFSLLTSQYSDGVTLENLNSALTNSNIVNTQYGATFASYLTSNFNNVDADRDGKISAEEIQQLMNNMATQGLTREQLTQLAATGASGISAEKLNEILEHFDDMDTNHDGKVTTAEITAYNYDSKKQEKIDEYNLAQLMYMLEVQTAIAGELYNINTYNQPGVEQAINYTYALMGRPGYDGSAEELRAKLVSL